MKTTKPLLRFLRDRSGATAIEYGLIAAVICLAVIGGVSSLGQSANGAFVDLKEKVDEASASQ